jgi:hypothetical protein
MEHRLLTMLTAAGCGIANPAGHLSRARGSIKITRFGMTSVKYLD